jgi:hypothetical protein
MKKTILILSKIDEEDLEHLDGSRIGLLGAWEESCGGIESRSPFIEPLLNEEAFDVPPPAGVDLGGGRLPAIAR